LTTTQRMKEFRTAHSESVVKEHVREPSRPNQKTSTRLRSSSEGWWR